LGQVRVDGQITAGPQTIGIDRTTLSTALALKGGSTAKSYAVATGILELSLNTPSAYQTLPGVGAAPGVTHADTLYFFSDAPVLLRLTTDDGAGGSVLSVLPVDGLVVLEFQAAKFLKLVEAEGTSPIEYFASGPS
jgi:hypothetical protein